MFKIKQNLDDSDLVGNVERVVVGRQLDVGLLGAIWADQGVHLKYNISTLNIMVRIYVTFWMSTSYIFFTAARIWGLLAKMSTMKTSVLLSSIFFMADSVVKGNLMMEKWSNRGAEAED